MGQSERRACCCIEGCDHLVATCAVIDCPVHGTERPAPSERQIEHLRGLVAHRPDDELRIVLHPNRCDLCRGLAVELLGWSESLESES